jgi:hypothetical protein
MANPLADFRKNVETVIAEHRKSSAALLRQLKQLSPQELLQRGPKIWSKLSIAEYREVIEAIAPKVRIPIVRDDTVDPAPMPSAFRRWWRGRSALGHRLIKAHPDSGCCEFDGGEIIVIALVVPGGDGTEMLEFVEEALDEVALSIKPLVERRQVHPMGYACPLEIVER